MIYTAIILLAICLTGCSMRNLATPVATIGAAGVGGIAGPGGAALGAGVGYASGKIYELTDENEELVDAITHGDVEGIIQSRMKEHASGFQDFTTYIKRILIGAAVVLGAYLVIPIFVARKCSRTEALKNQTRPPFQPK
jgi:hypothetical protein